MPLSENEQKILAEIERHLEESDPGLASKVANTSIFQHALGSLKWSVAGFVIGLVIMVVTLRVHYLVAFAGFTLMLVSTLGFERNLRAMGRVGVEQVSSAFRAANPGNRSSDSSDEN